MLRSISIVVALALLAPLAQAEEPDLPDTWSLAPTVPLGTLEGTLGGTDDADWVRVLVPDGMRLRVTLTLSTETHVHLVAVEDDGTFLLEEHFEGTTTSADIDRDVVRVGVDAWSSTPVSYTLELVAERAPDLQPVGLAVTPVAGVGPLGRFAHDIDLDVVNGGGARAVGTLTLVARTTGDGVSAPIATIDIDLAPGASRHVHVLWDALSTGTVGRADVIATTSVAFDADPANDRASVAVETVGPVAGRTLRTTSGACFDFLVFACYGVFAAPTRVAAGEHVHAGLAAQTVEVVLDDDSRASAFTWSPFTGTAGAAADSAGAVTVCLLVCVTPSGGSLSARAMEDDNPVGPIGVELVEFGDEGGYARVCATTCATQPTP